MTSVAQQQMAGAGVRSIKSMAPVSAVAGSSQAEGSVPAQQASVDAVIGMLTSWQKAQHVAP
jgi:hypothetical protein